jgi:dihydropyrimidinase
MAAETERSLTIAGGVVVTPAGVFEADVIVRGERIAGVVSPGAWAGDGADREVIDASGCCVLPGGVDPHTHLLSDVPAADAGLIGGTTTALCFTWPEPDEPPVDAFVRARDALLPQTALDVGLHAAFWRPDLLRDEDVRQLRELGVCGLKLYVAYPELGIMATDRHVYETMRIGAALGLPVQVHCENGDLIEALVAERLAAGRTGIGSAFDTRPPVTEEESVYRVCRLAELAGATVYLVHMSSAGSLDIARDARRRGARILLEVCTWSLTLDDGVFERDEPQRYLACPPPRSREHVEALWVGVRDGTVDALGSDHHQHQFAPPPVPDFRGIAYGMRGIRTRYPLLLSEGLRRGVAIERMTGLLSRGPARAFGVTSKGAIVPGADADLVVWDPSSKWAIGADHPAWQGVEVDGRMRTVLRRGETVAQDGELAASRSAGRFLRRATPTGDRVVA